MTTPSDEINWGRLEADIELLRVERRNKIVTTIFASKDIYFTELGDDTVTWQDPMEGIYYTLHHEVEEGDRQTYHLYLRSPKETNKPASVVFDNQSSDVHITTGRHALAGYELQERLYDVLIDGVLTLIEKGSLDISHSTVS